MVSLCPRFLLGYELIGGKAADTTTASTYQDANPQGLVRP